MLRGESDLAQPVVKLMCLALGLLFLGRQDAVEPTVEVGGCRAWLQGACIQYGWVVTCQY